MQPARAAGGHHAAAAYAPVHAAPDDSADEEPGLPRARSASQSSVSVGSIELADDLSDGNLSDDDLPQPEALPPQVPAQIVPPAPHLNLNLWLDHACGVVGELTAMTTLTTTLSVVSAEVVAAGMNALSFPHMDYGDAARIGLGMGLVVSAVGIALRFCAPRQHFA